MGALGDWVVLNETTEEVKRYFLRFDGPGESGLTERWWKRVDISDPHTFPEDAEAFFQNPGEESGGRPYDNATTLATWSPNVGVKGVVFLAGSQESTDLWTDELRRYVGPLS